MINIIYQEKTLTGFINTVRVYKTNFVKGLYHIEQSVLFVFKFYNSCFQSIVICF